MKTRYTLLSGERTDFETPPGELGVFLRRVLAAAKDSAVTERELSDLVVGPENPLLGEVHRNPAFQLMLDCVARKRTPPAVDASMSVSQVARQLGISESAVRQAIYSKRLRARKDGGTHRIDLQSVARFRVNRRGPLPRELSGGMLEAQTGTRPDASLLVKHVRQDEQDAQHTIPGGWHRIGILGKLRDRTRFWEIEPATDEGVLYFEEFFIRGGFRVVETCIGQKARAAFQAFAPR